jgi:hypothetical protein
VRPQSKTRQIEHFESKLKVDFYPAWGVWLGWQHGTVRSHTNHSVLWELSKKSLCWRWHTVFSGAWMIGLIQLTMNTGTCGESRYKAGRGRYREEQRAKTREQRTENGPRWSDLYSRISSLHYCFRFGIDCFLSQQNHNTHTHKHIVLLKDDISKIAAVMDQVNTKYQESSTLLAPLYIYILTDAVIHIINLVLILHLNDVCIVCILWLLPLRIFRHCFSVIFSVSCTI